MRWWPESFERLGVRTPAGRDAVVAAVLAVVGLARIPLFMALQGRRGGGTAPDLVVLANLAATADVATFALRRRAPRTALALALAVLAGMTLLPSAYVFSGIGVVVCAYTVATLLPWRATAAVLAAGCAAHVAIGLVATRAGGRLQPIMSYWGVDGRDVVDVVTASVSTFALLGLLGAFVQTRRAETAELRARAERMEAEREERARAAVVSERGRIARELHDVAAHDLSAIVVQAGAADRLVERDPKAARLTLQAIRSQGRETLSALRQLVGIMREADTDGRAPQPTLRRVGELIGVARDAGMAVEVTVHGRPRPLPAAVDLTAYRVVQEALTNARRHAPGAAATVELTYADEVQVRVCSGRARQPVPVAEPGGHGLRGMRERVEQAGGTLSAGPTDDGGWCIDALLPAGGRPGP